MLKSLKTLILSLAVAGWTVPAVAEPMAVDLEPIRHTSAQLTVAGPNGETMYTPAELESLGASRMVTITPWREQAAEFDGVLLTELLEANGLSEADAIRVVAENDYAVVIPSEVWKKWPILVATRVNGKAHTRRERGPIQFVMPMSEQPEAGASGNGSNWVWMAARIEAVE